MSGDKDKDTDLHRPDGIVTSGEKIGHADKRSLIRMRDGVIFKGDEIGYVDEERNIRKPDGFVFKGKIVGQVEGDAAHAPDGIIFSGDEWGYVDDNGNVRQRDGVFFRGRIVGQMRGHNKAAALGFYVLRFTRMQENFDALEREVQSAKNPVSLLGKVHHMLSYVPNAEALGDFDTLIGKLRQLENKLVGEQAGNRSRKESLCDRAESLSHSTDWKNTADALKALHEEWKGLGSAGREDDDALWRRFRGVQDKFFERRKEHFDKQEQECRHHRSRKESLCSRAEALSSSSDWKDTAEALKGLQGEWKQVGFAGRDHDQSLWQRFRHAQDKFFERRKAHFEHKDREQRENLHRKERICSEAESLAHSDDYRAATARVKELQAKWKTIGYVPRDDSESVWDRFRHACDAVFENARREHQRREHEWRSKMREALERKTEQAQRLRDSIEHDEGNVERWQATIDNLHPGGRADEIQSDLESKISDVEDKISSKRERLSELKDAIRDIESKLDD
jgi:hypothetical protein